MAKSETGHEAMRRFFILVIAGSKSEFICYANDKRKEIGDENFYSFGNKFICYSGEQKGLRKTLFKVYSFSYEYHFIPRLCNLTQFNYQFPFLNSWEITGTGERRPDFANIIDYCRTRWSIENPTTRKVANYGNKFKHAPCNG